MIKKLYYCDKCEREIGVSEVKTIQLGRTLRQNEEFIRSDVVYHICFDCAALFDEFMKPVGNSEELSDEEEIDEPVEKKAKGREVDMGKVKALRDAGWTYAKIADEFGVSPQTVSNWLNK